MRRKLRKIKRKIEDMQKKLGKIRGKLGICRRNWEKLEEIWGYAEEIAKNLLQPMSPPTPEVLHSCSPLTCGVLQPLESSNP